MRRNRSRSRTRQIPYIGNTVGTTSKQFLNDILMEDRRNHGGILHQMLRDDVRSAQPPKNPTRIVLKSTVTPFGILEKYAPPEPKQFQFDKTSGYYYDPETGFYYDAKTDYYYNKKTNQWMFWCSKFSTYINCEGGDIEQKRQLQDDERMYQFQQKQREFEHQQQEEEKIRNVVEKIQAAGRQRILDRGEEDIQMIGSSSSYQQPKRPREEIVESNNADNDTQKLLDNQQNYLRLNQEYMGILQKELAQAKDRHTVEQIKFRMHELSTDFEKIQNSLSYISSLSALVEQQSTSAQAAKPSLKRHITKESMAQQFVGPQRTANSPSVIELLDDDDGGGGWNRRKSRYDEPVREANHGNKTGRQVEPVWRPNADGPLTGRTAFDVHIEQAERLRVLKESLQKRTQNQLTGQTSQNQQVTGRTAFDEHVDHAERLRILKENLQKREAQQGFESQVRQMEDHRIQNEWPDRSAGTKRPSSSLERHHHRRARSRSRARGRDHSRPRRRHESPSRREASPRKSRYDRSESRHGREERRHRHNSRAAVGREPMAISPEPPAVVRMEMDEGRGRQQPASRVEKWAGSGGGGVVQQQGVGIGMQSGLPLMQPPNMLPIPPVVAAGFSSSLGGGGFSSPQMGMLAPGKIPPQFGGSAGPQIPAMLAPMGSAVPAPPNAVISSIPGMPPMFTANQIFGSNDDHWRMVANQQQEHILPGALSSKNAAAAVGRIPQLGSSQQRTPVAAAGQQLVCSFCGFAGHVRVDCPTADRMGKQKEDLTEKERARVQKLNLCLNCGRVGHTQFGCQNPRIPDEQLQSKIRRAEEKHKIQELEKQKLKKKAEKYPVRRKDPFIQRLREVAPSGKITKECVRIICNRCAHLNHSWNECARPVAGRSLYKEISRAMEEFTKIFFVHLNDENLVDFSQKFELFTVMDGIEQCGTLDPVGLQLQIICPEGIVTQGDLRELCSNCASLGHKQQDCPEKEACTRNYYDKMLSLVKAYRALVKEGKGNFLLPTAYQRPKPTQNESGVVPRNEEVLLTTSSEIEAANGNMTKDDKMEANNVKQGPSKSTTGSMSTTSAEEGRLAIVEEQDTFGSAGHNTSFGINNGNGAADAEEDDDIMVL